MITLFRHIRQKLIASGSVTKYLLYAIGEILLVVVGILIALQVNNWNEERTNKKQARQYSERLRDDLENDIRRIDFRVVFFDSVMQMSKRADRELKNKQSQTVEEKWGFILDVFNTSQTWPYKPSDAIYMELQNSGLLGHLGYRELLNLLSSYYEDQPLQLNQVNGGTQAYRDYSRSVIPMPVQTYIWESCFDVVNMEKQAFKQCGPPIEFSREIEDVYSFIIEDGEFQRLLTRRMATLYIRNLLLNTIKTEAVSILRILD